MKTRLLFGQPSFTEVCSGQQQFKQFRLLSRVTINLHSVMKYATLSVVGSPHYQSGSVSLYPDHGGGIHD